MKYIEIDGYRRITKPAARKMYTNGIPVYIIPCKLSPVNMYSPAVKINDNGNFDKYVNAFEYYNCSYEAGKYAAFYIKS